MHPNNKEDLTEQSDSADENARRSGVKMFDYKNTVHCFTLKCQFNVRCGRYMKLYLYKIVTVSKIRKCLQ